MKKPLNRFPKGRNERKIKALIKRYESQTDDEAIAEDEAAFNDRAQTVVLIPKALLPKVHKLLSDYSSRRRSSA